MNNIIEYAMLRTKVAMIGASGLIRARSRPMTAAPPAQRSSANAVDPSGRCARTSSASPPTKAQTSPGFETDDDGDDDRQDEHQVRLSVADRGDTVLRSVRTGPPPSHRPQRAVGSLSVRSSARRPKVARPLTRHSTRSKRRRRRGAVSHGPLETGNGRASDARRLHGRNAPSSRARRVFHVKQPRRSAGRDRSDLRQPCDSGRCT